MGDKASKFLANEQTKVVTQTKREMENNMVYSLDEEKWVKNDGQIKNCYSPSQVKFFNLKKLKDYTSDVKKAIVQFQQCLLKKQGKPLLMQQKWLKLKLLNL